MRDYADYFIDRKLPEKRGVSKQRDIDWWLETLASNLAKLLFVILLGLLVLSIKSIVNIGKNQLFFPIETIIINDDVLITTPKAITDVLTDLRQESFFSADLETISQTLTALPWVDSAKVTRHWPNQLSIHVIEHQAIYRWGENELLDALGNRFVNTNNRNAFAGLPKLYGIKGSEQQVIDTYQRLMTHLGISASHLDIEAFMLTSSLSWELHLHSGVVVKFGRKNPHQHLALFAQAYQAGKLPKLSRVESLDFRYRRGFSAKWKPEFAPDNAKLVRINHSATEI